MDKKKQTIEPRGADLMLAQARAATIERCAQAVELRLQELLEDGVLSHDEIEAFKEAAATIRDLGAAETRLLRIRGDASSNEESGVKKFRIRIDIEATLTVDQLWPDGDAPENPTVEDVLKVIDDAGRLDIIEDWCLVSDDRQCISVDGVPLHPGTRAWMKEAKR
jgi:hypothetical protein